MELSKDLVLLVDELIDAHDDTVRLSEGIAAEWQWEAHLCYLRELGRLAREAVAAARTDETKSMRQARVQSCRPGVARFRSSFPRRGDRRCARNGHGEGLA
jgi:hypothetical protein